MYSIFSLALMDKSSADIIGTYCPLGPWVNISLSLYSLFMWIENTGQSRDDQGCTPPCLWPSSECKIYTLGLSKVLACSHVLRSQIEYSTLQGGVITLDLPMTTTIRDLKAMLLEKHPCQDPIERKVLKVEPETLNSAGFLSAESQVTVAYTSNIVEAATKHDIPTSGSFAVKIPSNATNSSRAVFHNSHQLALLTMPASVRKIGENAFEDCTFLESINFGESVTHIGSVAFARCTSLKSITIGESIADIEEYAFQNCTSLESITFGKSVTHIGRQAFVGCKSLKSINFGESVTYIGSFAFARCTSLKSITIGESIADIEEYAFLFCTSLQTITIPESRRHIMLGRELASSSVAIITIPAKQGRKRLRNGWPSHR